MKPFMRGHQDGCLLDLLNFVVAELCSLLKFFFELFLQSIRLALDDLGVRLDFLGDHLVVNAGLVLDGADLNGALLFSMTESAVEISSRSLFVGSFFRRPTLFDKFDFLETFLCCGYLLLDCLLALF